jgi:putative PIN family toxin of toxin-antitoxin system
MDRVVLDTAVLVSAFITEHKQGISAALLQAAEAGAFQLYLSTDILAETERVLCADRRHLSRKYRYSEDAATRWYQALARIARIVRDPPAVTVVERDPADDMVIACALAAKADALVSRDKDLLSLGTYGEVEIITPEELLRRLRGR